MVPELDMHMQNNLSKYPPSALRKKLTQVDNRPRCEIQHYKIPRSCNREENVGDPGSVNDTEIPRPSPWKEKKKQWDLINVKTSHLQKPLLI